MGEHQKMQECGCVGRVVASRRGTHASEPEAMLASPANYGPRGVGAQCRGWRRLGHAYKTPCLPMGREHVLCCKNDSGLSGKLSLRRPSLR